MSLPRLYTVAQVAEYLDCDTSTVYRAIGDGRLRSACIGAKGTRRVTEPALLEFLGEAIDPDPTPAHGAERVSA